MVMLKLDRTDRLILEVMQQNGRISNLELAERVGLSPSPCSRRVKQLEDAGFIRRHVTLLNANKLNLSLTAYIHISMDLHTPERFEHFEKEVAKYDEVMECMLVTGNDSDYQLKVTVPDMEHFQNFLLGKLTRIPGVTGVRSSFILRTVIDHTELPLTHIQDWQEG